MSAIALANIPDGVECKLQLYRYNNFFPCFDGSNDLQKEGLENTCVSIPTLPLSYSVRWICIPKPPPQGYPPADVTLFTAPGCSLSVGGALSDPYPKVAANTCMPAIGGVLSLVSSGIGDIAKGQPVAIAPGYKCELVLYRTLLCYDKYQIPDPGQPGVCVNGMVGQSVKSFKWQCGPI
jgi:hypothetical protein